jgi:hypothetical protein
MMFCACTTQEATGAFDWSHHQDGTKNREASALMRDEGAHRVPVSSRHHRTQAGGRAGQLHRRQMMQASKMAALGVLVGVAQINNQQLHHAERPILREAWQSACRSSRNTRRTATS